MIILIDNYDSFTYNLVHYFGELNCDTHVYRNDKITVKEVIDRKPQAIVLSPGPCDPFRAGICLDLVDAAYKKSIPLLGVCLGHQTIGQIFGGKVVRANILMHGKTSPIYHDQAGIFKHLPSPFDATRYHSLIVEEETLPAELVITARTEDGIIMGLAHKEQPIYGVQFHPESIASEGGHQILANFLDCADIKMDPFDSLKRRLSTRTDVLTKTL